MAGYTQINLSSLPAPAVIEALDFETILREMRDDLVERLPEIEGVIDLESEPARKLLEVFAYRETVLRARINDAARAVMMAYATGTDLDHIGALFAVERMLITPANPSAVPPIPAVYETDSEFRRRIQIALEGFSVAGPSGAYVFHALSADPQVKDASATSPEPGEVLIAVLGRTGSGVAGPATLAAVDAALNDEDVRPLCDSVLVQSASIIEYQIEATIYVATGPDASTVIAASQTAAEAYANAQHMLGRPITISGIHAALHGPGVINVDLIQPAANIEVDPTEAAYCTGIILTDGGVP
jgi:phage-related baseplate assembly protein